MRSRCLLSASLCTGVSFSTAVTTSGARSTSCAPTSSSRSSIPTSVPSWVSCSPTWSGGATCPEPTMIPLADVQTEILGAVARLEAVSVPLRDALGLVTARDVVAGEAVPPFANTAMDGYAVRATDTAGAGPEAPLRLAPGGGLPAGRGATAPGAGGTADSE